MLKIFSTNPLNCLHQIGNKLETVSNYIGNTASWLILPFAVITFVTVGLRYIFDYGNIGLQETSMYLHAFILMLCMGYTFQHDEHVRIDIFYSRLSDRKRAMVNLFGGLLFLLPTSGIITIISFNYALRSWLVLEHSLEISGLPLVFILKSLIPAMAILLFIQGCADIALNLRRLLEK